VTVKIAYGTTDVEKAAESMELQVSDEEVEAILANIDSELSTLATTATHAAVLSRVFDELLIVCHAHASGDDD
jgi:glycerol-3-phosphate dehydrogenase